MILPILISVSVAPGSYRFCAAAGPVAAPARNPASTANWAERMISVRTIVLPDAESDRWSEAQSSYGASWRALGSNAPQSMHDWKGVASHAFVGIVRRAEAGDR